MTFPKMTVSGQCRLLGDEEGRYCYKNKVTFHKPCTAGIRAALGDLDKCCHIDYDLCTDICDEEKGTRYSDSWDIQFHANIQLVHL